MKRKNKAARAVNTALGLIVILAVILCSPLFGYARGFAAPGQREAAPAPVSESGVQSYQSAAATPRPTAQPTPTPVVLPSAPPAPSPTPVPTPRPAAVQQPVQQVQQPQQQAAQPQQNTQQVWQEEYYWEGEEGYVEEEGGEYVEETPAESYNYEGLGEQAENGVIATENADIVINTDMGGSTGYQEPAVQPAVDYAPPVQERSEGEAFVF